MIMEATVGAGSGKGIYFASLSIYGTESEFLLARNSSFIITDISKTTVFEPWEETTITAYKIKVKEK